MTVVWIDGTTGEHVRAADERGVDVAHQHEHFHACITVAHEHHRRRITDFDHVSGFLISGGG